ncbi:hypothetical protein Mapa_010782 [Marchantia paleacea]|nr:hypothetical protein Mapa_010782 [Marchantia paleacea]
MNDHHREVDVVQTIAEQGSYSQKLHNGAQSRLAGVSSRIVPGQLALVGMAHRLVHQVLGRHDGPGREDVSNAGQNVSHRPWRPHVVRDFAHGRGQNGTVPLLWLSEVDQQADRAAQGLAVEEFGDPSKLLLVQHGVEEFEAVVGGALHVREEASEALGQTMALEIRCAGRVSHVRKEDGRVLECPARVVAVAVHHADERLGLAVSRRPNLGEDVHAPRRFHPPPAVLDVLALVVLCLGHEAPREWRDLVARPQWRLLLPYGSSPVGTSSPHCSIHHRPQFRPRSATSCTDSSLACPANPAIFLWSPSDSSTNDNYGGNSSLLEPSAPRRQTPRSCSALCVRKQFQRSKQRICSVPAPPRGHCGHQFELSDAPAR